LSAVWGTEFATWRGALAGCAGGRGGAVDGCSHPTSQNKPPNGFQRRQKNSIATATALIFAATTEAMQQSGSDRQ
jgi:hypothetical protein